MALSSEDHKDVKGALGKAMANKISKVTRDGGGRKAFKAGRTSGVYKTHAEQDALEKHYREMRAKGQNKPIL